MKTLNRRIIHITDLHLPPLSKVPQGRTTALPHQLAAKIRHIGEIAKKEVALVVMSGDIFHYKDQRKYSPEDMNFWIEVFNESFVGIPVYAIAGNHDLIKSSMDNIDKSPYTTLCLATGIRDLREGDVVYRDLLWEEGFEEEFFDRTPKICIRGIPYLPVPQFVEKAKEASSQMQSRSDQMKEGGFYDFNIFMGHLDAFPDNDKLPEGQTSIPHALKDHDHLWYSELCELLPSVDVFALGHIHLSYGGLEYESVEGTTQLISKPWSLCRVAKDYHATTDIVEAKHKPSFALIDVNYYYDEKKEEWTGMSSTVTYSEVPHIQSTDAFAHDDIKKVVDRGEMMTKFVQSMAQNIGEAGLFQKMSAQQCWEEHQASLPKPVKAIIEDHLERLDD